MREANENIVPRSKEIDNHHSGWKTNFRDEFKGAHGKATGVILDDSAQSNDAPDWMIAQTERAPRNERVEHVEGWKTDFTKDFEGRAGEKSGAVLDDSAQSGDAPQWMQVQTERSPRGNIPLHKQVGRASNDLGVQGYRGVHNSAFAGAAGHSTGAVHDDSGESGDAPRWMRKMGAKHGVPRSVHQQGGGWKTTFDQELFHGAAGAPTGVLLDDSAQSNDAPDWMIAQTERAPRKKEIKHETGWKTDFTKEFEGRMGKPSGAVLDDSAQSGDAPDWMGIQTHLSPRGSVPPGKNPGRGSNDLGIQGYRSVDINKAYKNAAGQRSGILPDDSAVSHDLPAFMHIPEIAVHPGNARYHKDTVWKTSIDNHHGDTVVSAAAPQFFHIDGIGQIGQKWEEGAAKHGGLMAGSKEVDFNNAAGVTTGGSTDDCSVSAEMPEWMRKNQHVHVRNSTQRSMGLGKIPGRPVPEISHRHNNAGGYVQTKYNDGDAAAGNGSRFEEKLSPRDRMRQEETQLREKLEHAQRMYQQHSNKQKLSPRVGGGGGGGGGALAQAGRAQMRRGEEQQGQQQQQPQTSSNSGSRPITGSKPQKFPLSKPTYGQENRGKRSSAKTIPAPYPDHLRGPIPTGRFDSHDLPLNMQHQYYTFSTPKHLRMEEKMKMRPPGKYEPFIKRNGNVPGHQLRPTTRLKGSISHAKTDYDDMPLAHRTQDYRSRLLGKERITTRELTSAGLSPRGPERAQGWRSPRNMLNTAGSGQHPTVTSQYAPSWMTTGVTTNQVNRGTGRRC